MLKFIFDSLNKYAYVDDSQIVTISSKKMYTSSKERIEVYFRELDEQQLTDHLGKSESSMTLTQALSQETDK